MNHTSLPPNFQTISVAQYGAPVTEDTQGSGLRNRAKELASLGPENSESEVHTVYITNDKRKYKETCS